MPYFYQVTVFGSDTYTIKSDEPLDQQAIEAQGQECWNDARHTMGGTIQDAREIQEREASYIDVDLTEE